MSASSRLRKCLFPAAGYGTRFLPATKAMPKEMMPIVSKPLIQYGVEEALEAGLKEMAIVTGRGKRALEDHFDINVELEAQIQGTDKESYLSGIRSIMQEATFTYTRQMAMRGLGDAILTGEPLIGDESFAVLLADDLCLSEGQGVLAQMIELYRQFRCSIVAIEEVSPEETHKYGVIAGDPLREDLYRIEQMVEKPARGQEPSNLAIIGRYILTPDIFDILRATPPGRNGEIQITDALAEQARRGCVLAYRFKGRRFDCGSIDGYVEATNYCYRNPS
ncbi:MAG: UTP--glucose-1-phosphate uridylyltransferase GalU [Pseudomonadales bacterium]|nr:UTP--glucose-1-phosphate uridylyltransferase GalU [Pseudomonadales bacterium]